MTSVLAFTLNSFLKSTFLNHSHVEPTGIFLSADTGTVAVCDIVDLFCLIFYSEIIETIASVFSFPEFSSIVLLRQKQIIIIIMCDFATFRARINLSFAIYGWMRFQKIFIIAKFFL